MEQKHPRETGEACYKELRTIAVDQATFEPIHIEEITEYEWKHKVLHCFMMLTEKINSEGKFEKVKARFNANPTTIRQPLKQDDNASPTTSSEAVNTVIHSYVTNKHKGMVIRTYDITGAFLHAIFREGGYIGIIDKDSAKELLEMREDLSTGLRKDGTLLVKIVKALYGLEEAAKLFYKMITGTLNDMGYKRTDTDPCALVKGDSRVVMQESYKDRNLVALHVDDLICTFMSVNEAKEFEEKLENIYGKVQKHKIEDGVLNFTGRTIRNNAKGDIEITMDKITQKFLQGYEGPGTSKCPADKYIFTISNAKEDRIKVDPGVFLSKIMTGMYLAKNMRYDRMLPLSFLCTRVKEPTIQDQKKLNKILDYVKRTQNEALIYRTQIVNSLCMQMRDITVTRMEKDIQV